MANLEIFVFILRDSPASANMFSVRAHDGTVSDWKREVHATRRHYLSRYGPADLQLWKLNKPIKVAEVDTQEWPLAQDLSSIAVAMLPGEKLSNYFTIPPMEVSLQVIVVLPSETPESRKRIREDEGVLPTNASVSGPHVQSSRRHSSEASITDAEPKHKRTKAGCITCRVRGKKCDGEEVDDGESCATCKRLKLHCLGVHGRRLDWLRTKENVKIWKKRVTDFLKSQRRPRSGPDAFLSLEEMRLGLDAPGAAPLQDDVMELEHRQPGRSTVADGSAPTSPATSRRSTPPPPPPPKFRRSRPRPPPTSYNVHKPENQVPGGKTGQFFQSNVHAQDMNSLETAFGSPLSQLPGYGMPPALDKRNEPSTSMDRHTSAGRMKPCPPSTSTGLTTIPPNVTNAGQHYYGASHQPSPRLPPQSPQPQESDQLPSLSTPHSDADGVLPPYHMTGLSTSGSDTGHQPQPTDQRNSNDRSMTESPSARTLLPSGPHDKSAGSHSLPASILPSHVPEDGGDGPPSGAISPTTRFFLEYVNPDCYTTDPPDDPDRDVENMQKVESLSPQSEAHSSHHALWALFPDRNRSEDSDSFLP